MSPPSTPRRRRAPALRGWAACGLVGLLAGCSLLTPAPDGDPDGPVATARAGPPAFQLIVEAPEPLKTLVEKHLDLARLRSASAGEPVAGDELTRLLEAAPAQARGLLETEGYFNAQVEVTALDPLPAPAGGAPPGAAVDAAPSPASAPAAAVPRVKVKVVAGPQATVERVDLRFVGELEQRREAGEPEALATATRLVDGWALGAGQPFRNPQWGESKTDLLAQLRAHGYAAATLSGSTARVDAKTNKARLLVVADSGPLFRTGELRITGIEHQDPRTVQVLAGFRRGTPADESRLLDFQDRLQRSGLFDSVMVTLDTDPERAEAADILVRVRELPLQEITAAVGVDANTGPKVSLQHTHRRVFGWRATSINKVEWSENRQAWTGDLNGHAEEDFRRNLLGAQFERLLSENDTVVSQRIRLGRGRETNRIDRLTFVEVERSTRRTVESGSIGDEDRQAVSLNQHLIWRDLDSLVLPTRGSSMLAEVGGGMARGTDGRTGPFGRVRVRLTGYLPFGDAWFGKGRIELGQVVSKDDVAVPDSQRFRAGGDESVRGYDYRSLGPTVDGVVGSGNILMTGSLEVARPLLARMPSVWGAAFIDWGRATDEWRDLDPALGYGVGIRWRSPVGPLRFDVAYGEELRAWRTHLTVGITY